MTDEIPKLFVEINDSKIIFVAGNYDENLNFSIIEKKVSSSNEFFNDELINLNRSVEIIKQNIEIIENKINYIFKEVTIILDKFNCSCINISGYKRLNQSQILKENISYILNSLKLNISDSEEDKSILHIFNSKSVLDGKTTDNLPIGLFGNFYNHELTFILLNKNDLKNIKQIFNKNSINIKKIINKSFIEGANLIDSNRNNETFYYVKIKKKSTSVSFFESSAFRYYEKFNFGTNILKQDISKVCSIGHEMINNVLANKILNKEVFKESDFIENNFFQNENYRKIKKKLLKDIVKARIEEISNIFLFENINVKYSQFPTDKIFIVIEDDLIFDNFEKDFCFYFSKGINNNITVLKDFEIDSIFYKAANLSVFGWKKEAVPIFQRKNSLITRIFKSIFE